MNCGCDRKFLEQKEEEEPFQFEKENIVKSNPSDKISDIKEDHFDEMEEASEKRKGDCLSAKNGGISLNKKIDFKPTTGEEKDESQPEKMEKLSLKDEN